MAGEYSSGMKFRVGDQIRGYRLEKVFDSGGFAFAGKAIAPNGQPVFFKKYKRPGGSSAWFDGFVRYQTELKNQIQSASGARKLCYEFIEFFELKKAGGTVPLKAFYQAFEWVDGGMDLRGVLNGSRGASPTYSWTQRVIFSRVMMAGIKEIHKAGIIHTDLKPENFYLLPEPSIAAKHKLRVIDMDFSLLEGKRAPWDGHEGEGYVGTPGYMSPEHLANKVPQKASDVYTCGIILGELLGGGHPSADNIDEYEQRAKNGLLRKVAVQQPIAEVPDLEFLNSVINAALRPEARKRPTAEQLLQALSGQLAEYDGIRPRIGTPVPVRPPSPSPLRPSSVLPPSPAVVVAPSAESPGSSRIQIESGPGRQLELKIGSTIGREQFSSWGSDFQRFMSTEQFRLFKDPAGRWMIEHCPSATNVTSANDQPIVTPTLVSDGMRIAIGRTGKCPLILRVR